MVSGSSQQTSPAMKGRIQQVLGSEHTQGLLGKKTSSKTLKMDDFVENGRHLMCDSFTLSDEDKRGMKTSGGCFKVAKRDSNIKETKRDYKDQKESKEFKGYKEEEEFKDYRETNDFRDRKDHQKQRDYKDNNLSKAQEDINRGVSGSTERQVKKEDGDGHKRRAQDGETFLHWGQRKRPRYRDPPNGMLKTSIRVDRRVGRADKQIGGQGRGSSMRPSIAPTEEMSSGSGKRIIGAGTSGFSKSTNEPAHGETISGHVGPASANKESARLDEAQGDIAERALSCPLSSIGLKGGTRSLALSVDKRQEPDLILENLQSQPTEKVRMEFFEWPKIIIGLTRKEKEDDFVAIRGTKLPQRPKRRPKVVEKNVNFISVGTWLCDLSQERYEVREKKSVKKKPRGLKAMGVVDSDSE